MHLLLLSIEYSIRQVMLIIFDKIPWSDLLVCSRVSKTWFDIVERSNRMRLNISAAVHDLDDDDELPSSILRTYRNLRIEIIDNVGFASTAFQPIIENCWDVKIDAFKHHKTLVSFLSLCKNLKSLFICDIDDLDEFPVDADSETLDLAHILRLSDFRLDKFYGRISFDIMVPKLELRNLELTEVEISNKIMQNIIKLSPNLESLELYGMPNLTAEAFVSDDGLGAAKRLYKLVLPASVVDDRVVEKMQLPRLRQLCFFKHKVIISLKFFQLPILRLNKS
jgi:hypothetical protein